MAVPTSYRLPPTRLIPNSRYPLLHYQKFFDLRDGAVDILSVYDAFKGNDWDVQWVARYGQSQPSHYHPEAHEVMAVLTGPGTIRFGVGDTDADWHKNTYGDGWEESGLEVQANAGDVFIIPAGVAQSSVCSRFNGACSANVQPSMFPSLANL